VLQAAGNDEFAPVRDNMTSAAWLAQEVEALQGQIIELQNELELARAGAMKPHDEEVESLRQALDEAKILMRRREEDLYARLTETETALAEERERSSHATARIAAFEDLLAAAQERAETADHDAARAGDRMRALEDMLRQTTHREIRLRQEAEETRRKLEDAALENEQLTARLSALDAETESQRAETLRAMISGGVGKSLSLAPERAPSPRLGLPESLRLFPTDLPLMTQDGRCLILEVKPLSRMFVYSTLKRACAAMEYARETGAYYVVVSASGVTLGSLLHLDLDPDLVRTVIGELDEKGRLEWEDFQALRERFAMRTIHLAALVLQNDLLYSRAPWRLQRLPDGETFGRLRTAIADLSR